MKALAVGLCCAVAVSADFIADEYTVDLDQPAYERWKPVLDIAINKHGYDNSWGAFHAFLEDVLTHKEWEETAPLWDTIYSGYPLQYKEEINAFYRWLHENNHTDWTLGQLTMSQLFYEVEDACTSIVAQHTNGSIFHSRNLDYGLPDLQNFTTTITFIRNGQKIVKGTMYLGYCGLLTGQHYTSPNSASWSISLNQRFYGKSVIPYEDTIKELLAGVQNVGFTLRDALTSVSSFTAGTALMRNKPIPAPAYLIMAGTQNDEGVVITRDRNGTSDAWGTGRGYWPLNVTGGDWYRLETNFDNWEPITDGRRQAAHKSLDALGQTNADIYGLNMTLSTPPVLAPTTTYTANMFNAAGYYQTICRTHTQQANELRKAEMVKQVRAKMLNLLKWWREQQ
eukprot:TRINITY_DN15578_c0_g1_i1.p1 TRINITY_DN15578_c0_g1~~TRINITY_DN15578_c0_g1_i1.p1  ORF type:complete len:396 (+),score=151.76 TRINITY_DN15578_c0_g1_i1:55-1242(+)